MDMRKMTKKDREIFYKNQALVKRTSLMWGRMTGEGVPESVKAASRNEFAKLQKEVIAAGCQRMLDAALQRYIENREANTEAASEATGE